MKLLAIDSSAVSASVALYDGEKVIGEFFTNTALTHSRTLMPMVDALLKNTQTDIKEIDVFAVNIGPGSFTGLRIGIACIKGMAQSLSKPCVGISTLECIAQNGLNTDGIICACMDARCNQVYNALFECKNGKLTRLTEDRAIAVTELENELEAYSDNVYFTGDGSSVAYKLLDNSKYKMLSESNIYQRASSTAKLAYRDYTEGKLKSADTLMPVYLRLPQAERELKNKLNKKTEEN